ncbi:START domain-containing protein [Opitutales bacterium]|nr:START domain-containing protein [Opitutales bacterium]
MKFFIPHFISITLYSLLILKVHGKEENNDLYWVKIKEESGVSVYNAKIDGKIAIRGVGKIKGKPAQLVSLIENPAKWANWIENFKSGKLVAKINSNNKIFYQSFNSPFPVSDRDVVYESKIFRDKPKIIHIEMKSIEHPGAPKTIGVRINIIFTRYYIEALNDNTMLVRFESLSHPGGAIPDFLLNWVSASYPITLFKSLRRELRNML